MRDRVYIDNARNESAAETGQVLVKMKSRGVGGEVVEAYH